MAQEKIEEVVEQLKKQFGFLFERGRVIFADYQAQHFASYSVVLEIVDLRVRFSRDRGTIAVQAGPPWATAGWSGGPWYDLIIVIAFLTQKQILISEYLENHLSDDKQLERLAQAFLFYQTQIAELFRAEIFREKKETLDLVSDDIVSLLVESRRRSEKQKLLEQSKKFWQQVDSL